MFSQSAGRRFESVRKPKDLDTTQTVIDRFRGDLIEEEGPDADENIEPSFVFDPNADSQK